MSKKRRTGFPKLVSSGPRDTWKSWNDSRDVTKFKMLLL